jgi:cyanophycinase
MARKRSNEPAHSRRGPVPPLNAVPSSVRGTLIIIGGHEDKQTRPEILEEVARRAGSGTVMVATMATEQPGRQFEEYEGVFRRLGVKHLAHLDARTREELLDSRGVVINKEVSVVFFGGGDQVQLTSRFGGTDACDQLRTWYEAGGTIAGTSSGASALSETMLVGGGGSKPAGLSGSVVMAPGLGLFPGVLIDQHFAERGRVGRLFAALAQNPRLLGMGIDEDTAAIVTGARQMTVIGTGGVLIADAAGMTYTNTAEGKEGAASIYGITVHMLSAGDTFNFKTREPKPARLVGRNATRHAS